MNISLLRRLAAGSLALLLGLAALAPSSAWAEDLPPPPALPELPNPLALDQPTDAPPPVADKPAASAFPTPAEALAPDDAPAPDPTIEQGHAPSEIVLEDVTATTTVAPRRLRRRTWSIGIEVGSGVYPDPEGMLGLPLSRGRTGFDWGQNDLGAGVGGRLTVTRAMCGCDRFEIRGSYMNWSDDSRQTGQFGFSRTPGGAVLASPAATATLESEIDLWSFEANWWKPLAGTSRSRFEWGFGTRVLQLTDTAIAKDWQGLAGGAAYLEGEAQNTLWAGQAMGAWRLRPTRRLEFAIIGKVLAGVLNRNLTEKDNSIVTGGATTDAETERTDFGWGLEGEVRATWRPWARVGITASYTVLFLDDVSRGHEILDFTQAATGSIQILDTTDSIVVHTLFFGVQLDL